MFSGKRTMKFSKYQAAGNDFIITSLTSLSEENVIDLCDRNFGVGADGILVHYLTDDTDAGMKIINSDGSIAQMCGNGLRCFAAYLVSECGLTKNPLNIKTEIGVLDAEWTRTGNGLISVSASLGKAQIKGRESKEFYDCNYDMFLISMGNPHIVLNASKKLTPMEISRAAGHFQRENPYGCEVNVEVITDINFQDRSVFAIVRERGAGFTLACGTGGGAVIRSLIERKIAKRNEKWSVFFPGGVIRYLIDDDNFVTIEGIPQKVFSGEIGLTEDSFE